MLDGSFTVTVIVTPVAVPVPALMARAQNCRSLPLKDCRVWIFVFSPPGLRLFKKATSLLGSDPNLGRIIKAGLTPNDSTGVQAPAAPVLTKFLPAVKILRSAPIGKAVVPPFFIAMRYSPAVTGIGVGKLCSRKPAPLAVILAEVYSGVVATTPLVT